MLKPKVKSEKRRAFFPTQLCQSWDTVAAASRVALFTGSGHPLSLGPRYRLPATVELRNSHLPMQIVWLEYAIGQCDDNILINGHISMG